MSSEMTWFFDELDGYVKTQYRCFVAEMFLSEAQDEHIVCFRPVDVIEIRQTSLLAAILGSAWERLMWLNERNGLAIRSRRS